MLNGILRSSGTRLAVLATTGLLMVGAVSTVGHSSASHPQASITQHSGGIAPAGVFGWD